jgi:HAE1 family hydrophobic/amphiphilic exporter-1
MKLTEIALHRRVTVLMAFLAIVLLGIISWQRLPLDLLPSLSYPQITILTAYENVAPSEIEPLITKPIEAAVGTVKGLRQITSSSKEGISLVTLDFEWGTDINLAALDVREKTDVIRESLPREMDSPIIVKYDPASLPIMTLAVSAPADLTELTRVAFEEMKRDIERIEGVALARVSGGVEREILIAVDQGRLFAYGIPIAKIVDALKAANFNFPGGKIEQPYREIRIRTMGQFQTLKDFGKVVVGKTSQNIPVFLTDVAEVIDTFKDQSSSSRMNGKRSIGISIFKQADANTVQVARKVHQDLKRLEKKLNPKGEIIVAFDQSKFIQNAIEDLHWAGVMGGGLAFLVLLLFLHSLRSALIITTAIPISVLGTFALMYFSGISLNMMSLGGLVLGVGMLVDNGIVILENISRHREKNPQGYEATFIGVEEMKNPVIASTLAHVIVFLPIIFVKGLAGKFFAQLALTISFSLLLSILVALLLNPMLDSLRRPASSLAQMGARAKSPFGKIDRGMKTLEVLYGRTLSWALQNRKKVLLLTVVFFLFTLSFIPKMPMEFMPNVDQGQFLLKVTTPPESNLRATERVISQIEEILLQRPEVQTITANIGYDKKEKAEKSLGELETNVGYLMVTLKDRRERKRSVEQLVNEIRPGIAQIPKAEVEYILQQNILQFLKQKKKTPELLEIRGMDLEKLQALSHDVRERLKEIKGLKDIESSMGRVESEVQVVVDREKAASYKLTLKEVADTIKVAMEGEVATKFFEKDKEIDIRVRLRKVDRQDIPDLKKILIHTPLKSDIPLSEIASVTPAESLKEIQRRDQNRVAFIYANVTGRKFSESLEEVKEAIRPIQLPEGHFILISGEGEEMRDSFQKLMFALLLSVVLVYMLLASQFESLLHPFTIMFSVPLAIIGVMGALFLTGHSLSLGVYIGGIMLGGIVVNNSIILVDYTNTLRKKGIPRQDAVIEGGTTRLRPILMTALTTILGLVPLAISFGEGSEIRAPLAITVIGGLTSSTLLTLFIIPILYSSFEDWRDRVMKRRPEGRK